VRKRSGGPGWVPVRPSPGWRSWPTRAFWRLGLARVRLRTVALALVGIGVVTCMVPFLLVGYGMWEENQLTQRWSAANPASARPVLGSSDVAPAASEAPNAPQATAQTRIAPSIPAIFAMRVPKISYYAAVREGVSTDILSVGPGHYPGSALPGAAGLVAIAAHNTFWIPFGQLGPGDAVVLEARGGQYTYKVTGTQVVSADNNGVLAPTSGNRLALTTCWPLWAGNLAPQRLIIFAQQA
jgi:LPXTG-site transpeptidase (sortase) family protein